MTSLIGKFSAILTGISGSILATAVSLPLFAEWPYLKYLEVYFYDQDTSNTSPQRIRLWIEDLGNFSKAQYFKKATLTQTNTDSSNGSWEYLGNPEQDSIDYKKLIILAQQFIETQHYLNVARAINVANNWNSVSSSSNNLTVKCSDCCKKQNKCNCKFCLCCYSKDASCCNKGQTCNIDSLKQKQALFSYYLSNLNSPFQNVYLTPVQAHIKLPDSNFTNDFKIVQETESQGSSEKIMIGTLVYGFVDYSYKETIIPNSDDLNTYISNNLNLNSSDNSNTGDNKKYFYNIPQQFSFNKSMETSKSSEKKTISSIWYAFNKNITEEIKSLISKINDPKEIECCCCSSNQDKLDCLIKRNFVVEETNLSNIQTVIKDSQTCCVSENP